MDNQTRLGCIFIILVFAAAICFALAFIFSTCKYTSIRAEAVKRGYAEWYYPENSDCLDWRWKELPEKKGEK